MLDQKNKHHSSLLWIILSVLWLTDNRKLSQELEFNISQPVLDVPVYKYSCNFKNHFNSIYVY